MSTRLQRDKQTGLQEKHQAILSNLLKDEDNKYCVDCETKGPRWASWNLGVFLCIRCAGIHRNLGVHISKVKSVNLDTWTPEQIAMMVEIGNYTGRKVYEANLPKDFARPRTNSSLEVFIRAKYCSKKYMDQNWIPPKPKIQPIEDDKKERRKIKSAKANVPLAQVSRPKPTEVKPPPHSQSAPQLQQTVPPASEDLLGLDAPSVPVTNHTAHNSASTNDLFGDFLSGPTEPVSAATNQNTAQEALSTEGSLLGGPEQTKSTKDSIMALFGNQPTAQPQQYGVPGGVYMAQQPMQYGGMMGMQQGMMGQPQQTMGMMPNPMGMQGNMMAMQGMPAGMGMGGTQPQMYAMQPPQQMYMQQTSSVNNGLDYQQSQSTQLTHTNHLNAQVQQQLAGMSLGNTGMGYPQQGTMAAVGNVGGWNSQPTGHTLSTNLWQ